MKSVLKLTSAACAQFALQMVEMVDKVIFLGKRMVQSEALRDDSK